MFFHVEQAIFNLGKKVNYETCFKNWLIFYEKCLVFLFVKEDLNYNFCNNPPMTILNQIFAKTFVKETFYNIESIFQYIFAKSLFTTTTSFVCAGNANVAIFIHEVRTSNFKCNKTACPLFPLYIIKENKLQPTVCICVVDANQGELIFVLC